MGIPPAAAIAAVDPVAVQIHIPDDHTFKLFLTSYGFPPNRVTVPYWDAAGRSRANRDGTPGAR